MFLVEKRANPRYYLPKRSVRSVHGAACGSPQVPKDLLLGNPKSGAFSFEPKLSWASTTANGVLFGVTAVNKADRVDGTVKIAYANKKYAAGAAAADGAGTGIALLDVRSARRMLMARCLCRLPVCAQTPRLTRLARPSLTCR